MKNPDKMTAPERRVALALSSVMATRMLGLFMILPVFAIYAESLDGYSATLAGLAVGIYGLTQSVLQIPLGRLSDKIGRKPVIFAGLLLFALGSVVAAVADSMTGVIIGRALQGMGAIASAVMALAADLTREEHRTKMMAALGLSIGMSFFLAIILGPKLYGVFGVPGIFWLTAILALLGMAVITLAVPTPVAGRFHRDTEVELDWLRRVLAHPQLLRLDIGVLILHYVMTATLFSLPLIWVKEHGFGITDHWQVYLPVLVLSVVVMLPLVIIGEKRRQLKQVFIGAVLLLGLMNLLFWQASTHWWLLVVGLWGFFVAFNLLEASLPSLVAKFAPPAHKGTAMGAFASAQFLGAFLGAVSAGYVSHHYGVANIFLVNAVLLGLWAGIAISMRQPPYLSSKLLQVGSLDAQAARKLAMQLTAIRGVAEAVVIPEDRIAYLKVDNKALDKEALYAFSVAQD